MADTRDFLIGVLVGSAIGAAAALLYAPMAGAETRQLLKEKAEEAKDKTTQLADQAREKTTQIAGQAREKVGDITHTTQERVEELRHQTQSKINELTSQATGLVEKGKDIVETQKEAVISAVDAGRQAYREKQSELHNEVAKDLHAVGAGKS